MSLFSLFRVTDALGPLHMQRTDLEMFYSLYSEGGKLWPTDQILPAANLNTKFLWTLPCPVIYVSSVAGCFSLLWQC